jgi:hypothetical protein
VFVWLLACTAQIASAAGPDQRAPLFLTATNGTPNNFLTVVNTATKEVSYVPTGGSGGASGNAGGVAVMGHIAAVVNFGSNTVTIFARRGNTMSPLKTIPTASQPVSAAFGHGHLVVLGLTTAESFAVYGEDVGSAADGASPLLKSDKSAAQIVAFNGGVVYSEKSGSVAQLNLDAAVGAGLSGPNRPITLPTAPNNDTPFGMIARGDNVYLTIAHSDLEALVTNGQIAATAAGPMPYKDATGNILHAPCWNALHGQFLYSADSPGKQLLRYLVSDTNVFFDKSGVARLSGSPTDLAANGALLGVIDGGDGSTSNVSLFDIDSEGGLALRFSVKIPAPINGAAIVP